MPCRSALMLFAAAQAGLAAAQSTCATHTCQEKCVDNTTFVATADCQVGYTQGTWPADVSLTCVADGCILKSFVDPEPLVAATTAVTAATADDVCCDDATYADYHSCDVNGDGSKNYKDFLTQYDGIVDAQNWVRISATDDKTCRCLYTENSLNGVFTYEELASGGVVCYILGVAYMFLALAIVCDEFFVPALDEMVERLGISNDVAGATFMAAGGSAPELFTSLIGTFGQSSVGFGTIVGSAVFNVLFVIGMCALFSKETLQLTWWPLARDCSYYAMSLLVLAVFFGGIAHHPEADKLQSPDQTWVGPVGGPNEGVRFSGVDGQEVNTVQWWEALILLLMYVGYVMVMKYNERLRNRFDSTHNNVEKVTDETNPTLEDGESASEPPKQQNGRPGFAGFRAGMLDLLMESRVADTAAIAAVHRIKGNVSDTFKEVDESKDGFIDKAELGQLLAGLGATNDGGESADIDELLANIKEAAKDWDDTKPNQVSLGEFTDWYVTSENRIDADLQKAFERVDEDGNGVINRAEMEKVLKTMGNSPSPEELEQSWTELDADSDGDVNKAEFIKWYRDSVYFERRHDLDAHDKSEEEGVQLFDVPSGCCGKVMWLVTFPLLATMLLTMWDVRRDSKKKWYVATFFTAICWVGVYSYLMVWWATEIGCAFGIPDAVMGLTFLAAGTSVPDLLTSVIVARQGHGDMAVSSSIGSNIFDVLVGLPFPWIVFCIYKGAAEFETNDGIVGGYFVRVSAPTLFVSLLILFAMIALVIGTIILNKWKLTKGLGITMFVFYFLFVLQDLARTFEWV